ncbi:MAG: NfeD family protein [Bdellovibrionaceae bacterium]|nr:NfeD family protein [Pseudobdellovibrionaceae bacterium]
MQLNGDVLVWMIIGIALLSSEAFTGTFHLLFFGLAALLTAVLAALGVSSTPLQLVIFAVFSLISAGLLRKRLVNRRSQGFVIDSGSHFQLETDLPAGGEAVIRYQGAPWTALNSSAQPLIKGDRVRVVRTEGIKLIIEPAPQE